MRSPGGDLVQRVGWVVLFPCWGGLDAGEDLERLQESLQLQRPWLGHVLSLHSAAGIMLWEPL